MKIWGTAAFAQMRLIIMRRALPESVLTSPTRDSKPVGTDVDQAESLLVNPLKWLLTIVVGWITAFTVWMAQVGNHGNRVSKRGLVLLILPAFLLGVGLATATASTPTQSVHAASTFNQSAYNASSKKATWYIYTSLTNPAGATAMGGAQAYLDSAGTLHVSGTAPTTALANSIYAASGSSGFKLTDVNAVSFEGPTVFIDKSLGLFQRFTNLQKITGLSNVDVSRMTTMDYLFSSHSSNTTSSTNTNALLTTIEGTSNWDTSNVTSMQWTFEDQPNLTSVDGIQNWNTSKVTSMASLFYMDSSLSTMPDLSGWNTSKVTDTSYAFGNMSALTNIDSVLNWKMQSNTNIQGMFQNDSKLTFGGRLNWDTSAVTNFADVFWNDTAITSLDLSNWNVAKGDDFSQMFRAMTGLTSLDISGWQPTSATELGFMFYGDAKLTSLPGIDGWTLGNAVNLTSMFQGMSSVTDLPVSKWQLLANGKTNITNIFWGDNALTKLDLSGWTISGAYGASDKVFPTYVYSSSTLQSQLKSITFGSGWTGKVVLPQFQLNASQYGPWRGEKHDKANVAGVGTATETYTPPSTAADRVETFRFAYDIIAKIVNSQGQAMTLADVPVTVTGSDGSKVMSGNTGADGTVTLAMNSTGGDYTASLGTLPGGYDASVDTATAKIDGADVEVTFVVDEQNDADLINQYPHAGGHGTFLTVVAGVLAVVLGTTGMVVRRRV